MCSQFFNYLLLYRIYHRINWIVDFPFSSDIFPNSSSYSRSFNSLQVDYEFNTSTKTLEPLLSHGKENFSINLSMLLQWSPYSTEENLMKQVSFHKTIYINPLRSSLIPLLRNFEFPNWQKMFQLSFNHSAVWWDRNSWNKSYNLQSLVKWWWEYGARFWFWPRGLSPLPCFIHKDLLNLSCYELLILL